MSQPPGPPEHPSPGTGAEDPWATPSAGSEQPDPWGRPAAPYGHQPYGEPYRQPYGQPGYGHPAGNNGKAVAALWTSIAALVLTPCCGAGILGIVPVVLGIRARAEIRDRGHQQGGSGMALSGVVIGSVAMLLSLLVIAGIVLLIARDGSTGLQYGQTGV